MGGLVKTVARVRAIDVPHQELAGGWIEPASYKLGNIHGLSLSWLHKATPPKNAAKLGEEAALSAGKHTVSR